jgi:hypothetical protein
VPDADDDDLPDRLFENQAPLQSVESGTGPRRTIIPFSVVLIAAGLGLVLVVGVVIVLVISNGAADQPAGTAGPATIITPGTEAAPAKTTVRRPRFFDEFDKSELGTAYEVKTGQNPRLTVRNGQLLLGAPDQQTVRVDLTPRQTVRLFRQASVQARIEQGATFTFGIGRAAKLTVKRTDAGLEVRAQPGYDLSENIAAVNADQTYLTIDLERRENMITWRIGGQPVATSPDMATRSVPVIMLMSQGPPGDRVAVESVDVVYDPDT